jgi:hypothetical protein
MTLYANAHTYWRLGLKCAVLHELLTTDRTGDADGCTSRVVEMAMLHGRDLREEGFTVEQVIRQHLLCAGVALLMWESVHTIIVDRLILGESGGLSAVPAPKERTG